MDFKGITWAGNIYQKFETMCMEVEEVMYQDTVKYMENQVQKVGGSVKKFYSEVMQDLIPLSCVQPVKVAAASQDFSSIPNTHTDTDENKDELIFDTKAEKDSPKISSCSIRSLSKTSHGVSVQDKRPELFSGKTKKAGAHKPLGIKRISRINPALKDSCETINSSAVKAGTDDVLTLSSDSAVRCDRENSVKKMSTSETPLETPSSDKNLSAESSRQKKGDSISKYMPISSNNNASADSVVRCDHENPIKGKISTSETPVETPISDKNLSAVHFRENKGDSISKYMSDMSAASNNNTSADSIVRQIERASEHSSSRILPMESYGPFVVSVASNVESEINDAMTSNEDMFELELIENEEVTDPIQEITEPIETSKLDESCVWIEGNALVHNPQGAMKHHKSYKQKIHKAFLSKLRSTKKKHQVVSEYEDLRGKKPVLDVMSSEKRNLSAEDDTVESDWEIL